MTHPHPRPLPHSGRGETERHDPLDPHSHDPNPAPPSASPDFVLTLPNHSQQTVTPDALRRLSQTTVPDCFIVSTGHGTTGPFTFSGVTLADFVRHYWADEWNQAEVISGDGFGTRLSATEVTGATARPILLAHTIDGQPLSRAAGLVRLIVPSETDDALKQVKWVGRVNIVHSEPTGAA
ncbi:MAG: molybdopterin-dependent oxidoreductase [Caldilineaceae bacterium]|nr:molybdopterin-dependent oxidoreductase [Caldilineaceae bacterium]HRJ45417.1 molybdopterin-dependent oxidoreductase [Caldilineaceae bacterium]